MEMVALVGRVMVFKWGWLMAMWPLKRNRTLSWEGHGVWVGIGYVHPGGVVE